MREIRTQNNQLRSETDKIMLSLLDKSKARQMASHCPGHSGPQGQQTALLGNSVQYIPGMANQYWQQGQLNQSWPQFKPITENITTQNLEENNLETVAESQRVFYAVRRRRHSKRRCGCGGPLCSVRALV